MPAGVVVKIQARDAEVCRVVIQPEVVLEIGVQTTEAIHGQSVGLTGAAYHESGIGGFAILAVVAGHLKLQLISPARCEAAIDRWDFTVIRLKRKV